VTSSPADGGGEAPPPPPARNQRPNVRTRGCCHYAPIDRFVRTTICLAASSGTRYFLQSPLLRPPATGRRTFVGDDGTYVIIKIGKAFCSAIGRLPPPSGKATPSKDTSLHRGRPTELRTQPLIYVRD